LSERLLELNGNTMLFNTLYGANMAKGSWININLKLESGWVIFSCVEVFKHSEINTTHEVKPPVVFNFFKGGIIILILRILVFQKLL
jgi:flagellar assembly factor FliW